MPARLLRRDAMGAFAAGAWKAVLAAVVPNNRTYVANVTVANTAGATVTFSLGIDALNGNAGRFVDTMTLNVGEEYEKRGVVIPAGLALNAMVSAANGVTVTAMGEELDN